MKKILVILVSVLIISIFAFIVFSKEINRQNLFTKKNTFKSKQILSESKQQDFLNIEYNKIDGVDKNLLSLDIYNTE